MDHIRNKTATHQMSYFTDTTFGLSKQEDEIEKRVQELVQRSKDEGKSSFILKAFQPVNLKKKINLGPL